MSKKDRECEWVEHCESARDAEQCLALFIRVCEQQVMALMFEKNMKPYRKVRSALSGHLKQDFLHPQSTGQEGGNQAFDRFITVSLAFLTFVEVVSDSA